MPKSRTIFRYKRYQVISTIAKASFLAVLGFIMLFYPGQNVYILEAADFRAVNPRAVLSVPNSAPFPSNPKSILPGGDISATGVVVLDVASSVFIYKRNAEMLLSPASITKIMTALVALDTYKLDDVVTVGQVIEDGQVMGLIPGEKITVENLLYGILIHSGNDAAYALSDFYPGGRGAFVDAMNQKAKALHLIHTRFINPSGYDGAEHKTTAEDIARLAAFALTDKTIARIVAIPQITISDVTYTYFHGLKNVNQLLGKVPGVGGIKTGWTEEAGENLVTMVDRGGHKLIFVVLHSADRFGDTTRLIDWAFSTLTWKTFTPPLL